MAYNSYSNNAPQNQPYYSPSSYDRELPRLPSYSPQPGEPIVPQPSSSPFVGPFDDHVYPAGSRNPSNPSLGENASYYGQGGGGRPQDSNDYRDTIPLRDQMSKTGASPDHVYDIETNGRKKRQGFGRFSFGNGERTAWVVWILTIIQVAVFIAELVKCGVLTGIPIQTQPSFNPMIGPSQYILINMGSRYGPCMHNMTGIQDATIPIFWPCPNSTTSSTTDASNHCTLSELCGFGGVPEPGTPNQWFRFITPMFLHAGIIHIGFNMLLQATLGRDMEKSIGPIRFLLVYLSSGIFGFVLGGNFAASGISSAGASGALFGVIALTLLDLLYTWSERPSPVKDLLFILLDVIISFVLGLLPGLDNFSHIGGFVMGLVLGICILHSPPSLRRRIGADDPPYQSVAGGAAAGASGAARFVKAPLGFFKGRKPAWWAWWLLRVAALILVLVLFIVLLNNFYIYRKTCGWCKYLSCLPVNGWCELGNLSFTNTTTSKRSVEGLFEMWRMM